MQSVKSRDIRDIALASLGLNIDANDKKLLFEEISSVEKKYWYRCSFRNCDLLLIYGGEKVLEKTDIHWTEAANCCPRLKSFIDQLLAPYFTVKPRIIILKTTAEEELNWHVDCNEEELDCFQPKLRCLISGNKDDLFYLKKDGTNLKASIASDIYYMSGAYIHSLKNKSQIDRYVLCFGSPWGPEHVRSPFVDLLDSLVGDEILWNDELELLSRAQFIRNPQKHALVPYAST